MRPKSKKPLRWKKYRAEVRAKRASERKIAALARAFFGRHDLCVIIISLKPSEAATLGLPIAQRIAMMDVAF